MKRVLKFFKITGILIIILVTIAFLIVIISSKIGNSKINAEINGLGSTLLAIGHDDGFKFAFSFNDRINIRISPKKTSSVTIKPVIETLHRKHFRSKNISFYVEPNSEIIIKGESNNISLEYEIVKGNKLSFQRNELRKYLLPYYEKESQLSYESWKLRKKDPRKSRILEQKFDSLRFYTVAPLRTEWAKKHLDYELTPIYLLEGHIPQDTTIKYFGLLSEHVRESKFGLELEKIVSGWLNTKSGSIAPIISTQTISNELFELENLIGKHVIIYFWGTWCAPCITGMPKMKDIYANSNDKIEIVGISCYDKKDALEKTIKDHQINWINILNDKQTNDLASLYGVTSFPTKFILDKEGRIVGKYEGNTVDFFDAIAKVLQE